MAYPQGSDLQKLILLQTRVIELLETYRTFTSGFTDNLNAVTDLADMKNFMSLYVGQIHSLLVQLADTVTPEE